VVCFAKSFVYCVDYCLLFSAFCLVLVLFVLRYAVSDFPFGIFKCTFLGDWENKLFQKSEYLPAQYWRYVDDIWGIWEHEFDKLHEFHNFTNSLHSRIKIELRFSNAQIEFLDVNVSINNGHNKTDLLSKDTDKHMYLHVTSSHPNSVKNAIPYGLCVRDKRICSNENDNQIRRNEIKDHLRKRGYSNDIVENFLIFDFEFYWRQISPDFLEIYTNLYKVEQMKEQSLRNLGFIKQYELIALDTLINNHFFRITCIRRF
jgi:hypothetical protein